MTIVTDYKWKDEKGKTHVGFYMSQYLVQNLNGLPAYLKKAWDVVGIISGHGKVRIGKSTLAQQLGFYIAWMMAGGRMAYNEKDDKWRVHKSPNKKVNFNLKENIVFSPEDLMSKASELHRKYGRNQVIIYDEGRAGLDSARAMQAINKAMQDFFQECGMYGHIILIVLPSFFKLHEDYATSRSLFLIDVYANRQLRRGYFNFYTERQKEYLYEQGKKKLGTISKYIGASYSFTGRFTRFLPIDKNDYEEAKRRALKSKQLKRTEARWKQQRDAAFYLLKVKAMMTDTDIAADMKTICGFHVYTNSVGSAIEAIERERNEKFS